MTGKRRRDDDVNAVSARNHGSDRTQSPPLKRQRLDKGSVSSDSLRKPSSTKLVVADDVDQSMECTTKAVESGSVGNEGGFQCVDLAQRESSAINKGTVRTVDVDIYFGVDV